MGLEHKTTEKKTAVKWLSSKEHTKMLQEEKPIEIRKELVLDIEEQQGKPISFKGMQEAKNKQIPPILSTRVSTFDQLIADHGFERGSTILISGGAGTGKTTFCMQSIYNGALYGEKGIYLSFEEQPEKIIGHMKKNYGMDFEPLIKAGLVAIIKIDPGIIARSLEESLLQKEGGLKIRLKEISLPFVPARICVDSLSALSIAFEKEETYRKYIREMFESLETSQAISFVITETEQNPTVYSRTGVEEFLAEGVMVLYNLKKGNKRENALEILKLRSSRHKKGLVPYTFGPKGIEILA